MRTLPRKKIPASERKRPYLWIGNDQTCFGCVPDRSVEKLRDMCNAILERRKIED